MVPEEEERNPCTQECMDSVHVPGEWRSHGGGKGESHKDSMVSFCTFTVESSVSCFGV